MTHANAIRHPARRQSMWQGGSDWRRPLHPALLSVLLVLGGCAAGKTAHAPVAFESHPWTFRDQRGARLISEHYDIFTTIRDPQLVRLLPELMETAFAHYQQRVPPGKQPTERMQVYLFATRAEWADFTRRFTGPRASIFLKVRNGGYSERGVSVIEYTRHQTTFPLMTHEGFHQYLYHYVNDQVPAWLNEGLAVMFEGQRWIGSGAPVFDPHYNPARHNALAEAVLADKLFPLRELLDTHAGNVIEHSSRTVATYYAQVWALVLFLEQGAGGKYAAGFHRMCDQLRSRDIEQFARASFIWSPRTRYSFGEALFRTFITDDVAQAEQEYRAFLRQRFVAGR